MISHPKSFTHTLLAFAAGTAVGLLVSYRRRQQPLPQLSLVGDDQKKQTPAEELLWQIVTHSFTGALLNVGDKLRIYDLLWSQGPATPQELANQTGWSARWLLEFLCQMTAVGICRYHAQTKTFSLATEFAELLCNEQNELFSKSSIAGMFPFLMALLKRSEAVVVQGIRTGIGVGYDWPSNDDSGIVQQAQDRKNRPWYEKHLMQEIIEPILMPSSQKSLVDLLEQGVNVADVGCGCGASTLVMARRFSKSHFYAYESSLRAIEILHERLRNEKISNVTVCDVSQWTVGDGPRPGHDDEQNKFSFVYSHDVLHDMTHPRDLIREVRKRLHPKEGCWIIVDVDCSEDLSLNLLKPDAAQLYGFSCLLCLPSATMTSDGEGLGTLGLSATLCQKWTRAAGFDHFVQRNIPSAPSNVLYVVA